MESAYPYLRSLISLIEQNVNSFIFRFYPDTGQLRISGQEIIDVTGESINFNPLDSVLIGYLPSLEDDNTEYNLITQTLLSYREQDTLLSDGYGNYYNILSSFFTELSNQPYCNLLRSATPDGSNFLKKKDADNCPGQGRQGLIHIYSSVTRTESNYACTFVFEFSEGNYSTVSANITFSGGGDAEILPTPEYPSSYFSSINMAIPLIPFQPNADGNYFCIVAIFENTAIRLIQQGDFTPVSPGSSWKSDNRYPPVFIP